MNTSPYRCLAGILILSVLLVACGGGGAPASSSAPASSGAAQPTAAPPQELTPKELGDKIGALYVEALQEVTKMLESKPAAAEALPKVKDLKEKYIQQLVELGKKREALNTSDRATVDSAISSALTQIEKEAWYKTYSDLLQYYFKEQDFYKVVYSFNIIGQYASFDLLKKQEPKEAERLGIK